MDKSLATIEEASLVIHVLSNNEELSKEAEEIMHKLKNKTCITFVNKNDLPAKLQIQAPNLVYGNTLSLDGIEALKNKIIELFDLENINTSNLEVISSVRIINLIKEALKSINEALNNVTKKIPVDMLAIDIKQAWILLGEITGETYQDELLDTLFSKFCLGK